MKLWISKSGYEYDVMADDEIIHTCDTWKEAEEFIKDNEVEIINDKVYMNIPF